MLVVFEVSGSLHAQTSTKTTHPYTHIPTPTYTYHTPYLHTYTTHTCYTHLPVTHTQASQGLSTPGVILPSGGSCKPLTEIGVTELEITSNTYL